MHVIIIIIACMHHDVLLPVESALCAGDAIIIIIACMHHRCTITSLCAGDAKHPSRAARKSLASKTILPVLFIGDQLTC